MALVKIDFLQRLELTEILQVYADACFQFQVKAQLWRKYLPTRSVLTHSHTVYTHTPMLCTAEQAGTSAPAHSPPLLPGSYFASEQNRIRTPELPNSAHKVSGTNLIFDSSQKGQPEHQGDTSSSAAPQSHGPCGHQVLHREDWGHAAALVNTGHKPHRFLGSIHLH